VPVERVGDGTRLPWPLLFESGSDDRVAAVFTVARVTPFDPGFPATVLVLTFDLHGFPSPWHSLISVLGPIDRESVVGFSEHTQQLPSRAARLGAIALPTRLRADNDSTLLAFVPHRQLEGVADSLVACLVAVGYRESSRSTASSTG
jgi:hypothetical protein